MLITPLLRCALSAIAALHSELSETTQQKNKKGSLRLPFLLLLTSSSQSPPELLTTIPLASTANGKGTGGDFLIAFTFLFPRGNRKWLTTANYDRRVFTSATRMITRLPSARAARVIVSRVTETFRGSSSLSSCDLLV